MKINFDNSYLKLPNNFYQKNNPEKKENPQLIFFNKKLANSLNINYKNLSLSNLAEIFCGNKIIKGSKPISLAYGGHQFGHFNFNLGDGRAHLLGEIIDRKNQRFDIQLKGSGKTKFSRNGDGKMPLDSGIREYIISEFMNICKIPTTRSLALVKNDDLIFRQTINGEYFPSCVLTRIAKSHIRIGSFEYFLAQNDVKSLKILTNYAIKRHYPDILESENRYLEFFKKVCKKQAELIVDWMAIGFVHGVLNTDNVTISGETIDYGPCAFLEEFDENKVFSSIDHFGRYSYKNQREITLWNLSRLAISLIPIMSKSGISKSSILESEEDVNAKKFTSQLNAELAKFPEIFDKIYYKKMLKKIGIFKEEQGDRKILQQFLEILQKNKIDFTLAFRKLSDVCAEENFGISGGISNGVFSEASDGIFSGISAEIFNFDEFENWQKIYLKRIAKEKDSKRLEKMNKANPLYIPRNHLVKKAIDEALKGNFEESEKLIEILKNPFKEQNVEEFYKLPANKDQKVELTFCGT